MLKSLVGEDIYNEIIKIMPITSIGEVRMRIGRNLSLKSSVGHKISEYIVSIEDIASVIRRATKNSLYACQEELRAGFLRYEKGIRIGISGEGVCEGGKILTFKNISSLNIRVPHEIIGAADAIGEIFESFDNTIVLSPPYGGKTTLIRDMARVLSQNKDTLVIDERGEICCESYRFGPFIDIVTGAPKSLVIEGIIRAMNPEVIVMDELYPIRDSNVIAEIARSGIKMVASAHAKDHNEFFKRSPELKTLFRYVVNLSYKPHAGSIKSIIRL